MKSKVLLIGAAAAITAGVVLHAGPKGPENGICPLGKLVLGKASVTGSKEWRSATLKREQPALVVNQ